MEWQREGGNQCNPQYDAYKALEQGHHHENGQAESREWVRERAELSVRGRQSSPW